MKRFLVMGMIFATVAVPLALARDPKPARGFRRLGWVMLILTILWGILLHDFYFIL